MTDTFYAGIGSRETPVKVLVLMTQIAKRLEERGYILRSGGADGADSAFAQDVDPRNARVYLPWHKFNGKQGIVLGQVPDLRAIAKKYHPAWSRLSPGAQMLMTRNVAQVLGAWPENQKSEFVVCWTPDAKVTGGTGQAMRIAKAYGIEIYNLADSQDYWELGYDHMGGDAWPEE